MEKTEKNLFLTGKAGTGKSTLLEYFKNGTSKKCAVLAPTGVAALNVQGETIHSFFLLKPGFELDEAREKKTKKPKFYQRLEMIIIDEISMVRADLLDAIDIFLRKARNDARPFGGVQMVFIGDLYQLPPVLTRADREKFASEYDTAFFFGSQVMQQGNFDLEVVELEEIYRQEDEEFIEVLNAVRQDQARFQHLEILNSRVVNKSDTKPYIHLTTTNKDANSVNNYHLEEIFDDEVLFEAVIQGKVERSYHPTDELLNLKVGAQIMFVNNDSERKWVNGTIGTIVDIDSILELIVVETSNGKTVEVTPHTWEISKYVFEEGEFKREIIGSFKQMPLKLAWAITIHKSQGKTFDNVIIDLGRGSFAHGQTYVALSRCRSLEGMILKRPIYKKDIIMSPKVEYFFKQYRSEQRFLG